MTKEERRAAMPWTTAIIDALREAFGEPAAIKASENGIEVNWRKA